VLTISRSIARSVASCGRELLLGEPRAAVGTVGLAVRLEYALSRLLILWIEVRVASPAVGGDTFHRDP